MSIVLFRSPRSKDNSDLARDFKLSSTVNDLQSLESSYYYRKNQIAAEMKKLDSVLNLKEIDLFRLKLQGETLALVKDHEEYKARFRDFKRSIERTMSFT